MKKRLLCLLMAILMLSSVVLVSCADEKTDDQIRQENVCKADTAYTLSVWIPTNASSKDVADENSEFNKRLNAVEEAINDLLSSNSTRIEIVAKSNDEYDAKLMEKLTFASSSNLAKPSLLGEKYVNSAYAYTPPNAGPEDYFYKLKYPEILENQVDICLIRDYTTYNSLVGMGALHPLNSYVTASTASYPRILKMIRTEFVDPLMIKGSLYAIPNNRKYVEDDYQYILINKELAGKAELTIDENAIKSLVDCEEIINKIGELNLDGIVPLVGNDTDISGILHWGDEFSTIVSTKDNTSPNNIFENELYIAYTSLYKNLSEKNFVKAELSDGEIAGVFVFNGTKYDAETAYADDYYLIKTEVPVLTEKQAYGSMFAISEYSINYDRAMDFLYQLHTNEEIRTLIQYGIKDIDYVLDYSESEDDPKIELIKDADGNIVYDMCNDYTGNAYLTYKEDGSVIDEWDYIKSVNYDAVISKYMHFQSNYNAASDAIKSEVNTLTAALVAFNEEIFTAIRAMTYAEFIEFVQIYNEAKLVNIKDVTEKLEKGLEEYNTLKPEEQNKKDELQANLDWIEENKDNADVKDELADKQKKNTELQAELDKISAYDELLEQKALYESNDTVKSILDSETFKNALDKYSSLNKTYNK